MSPTPTQQPAPDKPKRSRWLKGCLILLLVPFVALALLYAWLASEPAGYREAMKASQAAREKILTPRLAPRETKTPPASSVPPSSLPTPSAAPISPEEARFWGDARARLEWWLAIYRQPFFTLDVRMMKPEEWRTDPVLHTPCVTSENARAICQEDTDLRVKRFPNDFERSRASRETENHPLDDPALIQKGIWTIRDMDRMEGLFLDPRWNEKGGPDPDFVPKNWSPQHPVESLIYLTLYRALQNGDTEKASTLVERYVRLYGTYYFYADSYNIPQGSEMIETLERFLSWVASDPRVPEEILEWTATTLASWPLSPQEYSELCVLNLNRSRENIVLSLEERTLSHQHDDEAVSGLERAATHAISFAERRSFQVLQRTLDRKMTALIQQDRDEYRKAQTIQELALLGMGHDRDDTPITGSSGSFYSFDHFLIRDALAYDSQGTLIEKPGYLSTALFGQLKDSERTDARPPNPSSAPPQSAFSSMKLEEVSPEFFNETIGQVRLAFAATRYRREHGRYPASVEEMIPRYLGESFKPNSEQFWTLVRMEPLSTVVTATPYYQKAVLEDPQTSASWSTAWWCVDPPSSFTQILAAYTDDPRNKGRAPENLEDLKPYAKPDVDLTAFAPYFIQTDEYLLITRVLLKDPRQKAFYEFQKEMNAAQGKNDETLRPDTPLQTLYVSIPPWNPQVDRGTPPGTAHLPIGEGKK